MIAGRDSAVQPHRGNTIILQLHLATLVCGMLSRATASKGAVSVVFFLPLMMTRGFDFSVLRCVNEVEGWIFAIRFIHTFPFKNHLYRSRIVEYELIIHVG